MFNVFVLKIYIYIILIERRQGMDCNEIFRRYKKIVQGKIIVIVYIFEGEDANGYGHYHIWKSDIISSWMLAVQELGCKPYILDVRTFMDKVAANALPSIDYVLNLNCGTINLSTLGVVPSICGFLNVPCIPCDVQTMMACEDKKVSNMVALSNNWNVPPYLDSTENNGIFRPINLGSSVGVGKQYKPEEKGIYQKFIRGFDITTPIVYNPVSKQMQLFPTIIYLPQDKDTGWYFGELQKKEKKGYTREIMLMQDKISRMYLDLVQSFAINTFCRVDARIECENFRDVNNIMEGQFEIEQLYFIEINSMPTISKNNSFSFSYNAIDERCPFYWCIKSFSNVFLTDNLNAFLLLSSMMSKSME